MASGGFGNASANKIKGGRWTVFRFFFVSLAFTIAWMTVSSLLAHYKLKYGPAILLQMNIAYFLPSIPLLLISSCLDEWLDHKLGVAKTILARLLLGLGGCTVATAVWPFAHSSHRTLLFLTVVLGLVSGIAFSASYQLVARFANKNTISLGLGCVGSGIVTLIFQLVLQMGPNPTRKQELILFELTAGMIVLGMLAAISLLIRHWAAIENSIEPESTEQLLSEGLLENGNAPNAEEDQRAESRRSISLRKSLSLMLRYAPTPMDPFDTVSDPERMEDREQLPALDLSPRLRATTRPKDVFWEAESLRATDSPIPTVHSVFSGSDESLGAGGASQAPDVGAEDGRHAVELIGLVELLQKLWPIMSALFLVGTMLCTVFPFFTYVPSSGIVGDSLPKVLFFIRLFADLTGRTLPRLKFLAVTSQRLLFALACLATGTLPMFFLYLKAPSRILNDYIVMGYVVGLWGLLGYINTCSYILAPQRVPVYAKGAANGALAIIYQASHCLGLVVALFLAAALYGLARSKSDPQDKAKHSFKL